MQRRTTGRLIRRTRAAGPGLRSMLVPSPVGRRWQADAVAHGLRDARVDGIMLSGQTFGFADGVRAETALPVHIFDAKTPDGPMALLPEQSPLLLGPTPGQARSVDFGPVEAVPDEPAVFERLRLIDAIMTGHGKVSNSLPALDVLPVSCAIQAGRRLSRHALQFLVTSGGTAPRTVLRDGQRARGQIWSPALKGSFHLRFSRATTTLWLRWDPAGLQSTSEKVRRRRIQRWMPDADIDTGDWIVLARLLDHRHAFNWQPEVAQTIQRWCIRLSPLAALAALDGSRSFEPLLSPAGVRIIECVDDWIRPRWRARLDAALKGRELVHIQRAQHAIAQWIDVLDNGERLDLARALLIVMGTWAAAQDPVALRERTSRHPNHRQLRRATAQVFDIGKRLSDLRQQMGNERFGDPRYAEAQLFLADYDAHFAPHAAACAQGARRMRGVIG